MERPRDALPEGTKLAGYIIGRVLGRGGFGITYFGHDALFPEAEVAIKEFMPVGLAVREAGTLTVHPTSRDTEGDFRKALSRFEEEARTLVTLRHPNVVEVQRYVEANGTAYVVMKYEEGRSLSDLLSGGQTLSADELERLVPPLLDGLEAVHQRSFLHRDIKPGNIYIRAADRSPVLLDFGAARQAMGSKRKTSLTEIFTPGYAPFEQYFRKGAQGPWTDIYAFGATLYRCIAGVAPPEAPERQRADTMVPAQEVGRGRYPIEVLAAVDAMLATDERARPQSVAEVRSRLNLDRSGQERATSDETLLADGRSSPASRVHPRVRDAVVALLLAAGLSIAVYLVLSSEPDVAPVNPSSNAQACREGTGWRAGCVFRDCSVCPEMTVVPAGTFFMGSPADEKDRRSDESPRHSVTISKAFAIGRYELALNEFASFARESGFSPGANCESWDKMTKQMVRDKSWREPGIPQTDRHPVVCVSWHDVKLYAAWLTKWTGKIYRLPSEAEWEYAARANTTTAYYWGNNFIPDRANCFADCRSKWTDSTAPVGEFPANGFGLYDMAGNVQEWTEDCWHESYAGAPTDERPWLAGDCARRVVRGGSFGGTAPLIRSASRLGVDANTRHYIFGFRVARMLE